MRVGSNEMHVMGRQRRTGRFNTTSHLLNRLAAQHGNIAGYQGKQHIATSYYQCLCLQWVVRSFSAARFALLLGKARPGHTGLPSRRGTARRGLW